MSGLRVRYVGRSFGVDGLTNGEIYDVLRIDELTGALVVVDDSGEDYLYSPTSPKPLTAREPYGRFEIIEDDDNGTLAKALQ